MKRRISLFLVVVLAMLTVLSACGKSKNTSGSASESGSGSGSESEAVSESESESESGSGSGSSYTGAEVIPTEDQIPVDKASESSAVYGTTTLYALEGLDTASPDGRIVAHFWADSKGGLYYNVLSDKEEVIIMSKLGLSVKECSFASGFDKITTSKEPQHIQDKYDTCLTISQKDVQCMDDCIQRRIYLKKDDNADASMTIAVRVYNDGFAFRYENVDCGVGKGKEVSVVKELTQTNLPDGTTSFAGGYGATYEIDYVKREYAQLKSHNGVFNTPFTADTGKRWMLLSESDAYAKDVTYCKSVLATSSGNASLNWQFGFRRDPAHEVNDDLSSPGHIRITTLKTTNGFTTPWRVAIIADDLNGLINSSVIDSLCPPMDTELFADTSWIQPGKVSWSWWSGGDQHNYDVQVDHVEFAADNGWEYCCLDAGWPVFEEKMPELCAYAKSKDVGIIVWVNYLKLKTPEAIEKLFSQWSEWGVVGVKTDYFESDDINVMECMRNVAEIAAKYKLMVYYHGCINPCGETRTYPNIMSSEAVLGEEFRKWSEAPEPKNCLMYPFTRNITGSMDYTPACIAITKTGESGGFSLAKAIVYESSLQHFASSAYSFPTFLGLPLLNKIPTAWQSTKLIEGYPGEYITIMRTNGKDYYVGAMTLQKRKAEVSLDFLGDGTYNAYIYQDNEAGKLTLETKEVTAKDTLSLDLIDIGGAAVMITKDTVNTDIDDPNADKEGYDYYECEDGVMNGAAVVADSSTCSGAKKAGWIGSGKENNVTITVKAAEAGTYDLIVYYCTGEDRDLDVIVNGKTYPFLALSGQGFDIPSETSVEVELKKGENEVVLTCEFGYAPDLDRIAIGKK